MKTEELLLGCMLFGFHACTGTQDRLALPIVDCKIKVISISAPLEESILHFSDFATSLDFIPLEDCDDGMISSVNKLMITKDGDFLIFDEKLRKIARFDSIGHFRNLIGEIGRGPNELVRPIGVTYDVFTDHVFVNDNGKLSLLEYDLNGKLIRRKYPYPFGADDMGIIDEEHYCFYSDFLGKPGFNYLITDKEFNEVGGFEPFEKWYGVSVVEPIFAKHGKSLLGRSPNSNYIYQISADTITTLYRVDYQGQGNWLSEKEADARREKYLYTKDIAYCWRTHFSDNYVFMFIVVPSEESTIRLAVYNRNSGALLTGRNYVNDVIPHYPASTAIDAVHDNKMYAVCYSDDFQHNIESMQSTINLYQVIKRPLVEQDTLSALIDRFTPYAQKANATIQITHLK